MAAKKAAKKVAKKEKCDFKSCGWNCSCGAKSGGGCLWFLGFIGAAVYYISTATGFWMGVWGVIKALVRAAHLYRIGTERALAFGNFFDAFRLPGHFQNLAANVKQPDSEE